MKIEDVCDSRKRTNQLYPENFSLDILRKDNSVPEKLIRNNTKYPEMRELAQELLDTDDTIVSVTINDDWDYWETWSRRGNLYNACVDSGRRQHEM